MFGQAKPIWPRTEVHQMNSFAVFEAKGVAGEAAQILIAASGFYRLYFNERFIAFGPARTAKGYARVDRIPVPANLVQKENDIRIEAVNYDCVSLSLVKQQGFLTVEVLDKDHHVLAFTGRDFSGFLSERKLRYVERYSAQRQFGEVWDERAEEHAEKAAELAVGHVTPVWLERSAPYPDYHMVSLNCGIRSGYLEEDTGREIRLNRYSFDPEGFEEEKIPYKPFRWIQRYRQVATGVDVPLPFVLKAGEFLVFDLKKVQTGFTCLTLHALEECDAVLAFSEYCRGDEFEFTDINCQNVIEYLLPGGKTFEEQSFEPYTLRFAILALKSGSLSVESFGVRTYERNMKNAFLPKTGNATADAICEAAARTFAHNAVDIFTDCPSRERAGWLCDSYFTGKAEYYFFGKTAVEDDFLENYRLYCADGSYPAGILPMCYPSEPHCGGHTDPRGGHEFIPQWNLWYILECEEYLLERSPKTDREKFRESIYGILGFMSRYENTDGLLEDVVGWNFVEWSEANKWVKDVSYPTNMLYSRALEAAYRLYGDRDAMEKAEALRNKICKLAFDGEVFCDHAVRRDGVPVNQPHISEACQYYAILYGGVDLNAPRYAKLKAHVLNGFADFCRKDCQFVHVNAFIGLYLRMEVLRKLKEYRLIMNELGDFFGGMVEGTGTLWEYRQHKGSYDHGFASYIACVIGEASGNLPRVSLLEPTKDAVLGTCKPFKKGLTENS